MNSGSLERVSAWLIEILSGSLAVSVAIIAVASLGLLLLSGRLDIRRGLRVVLGCFLVFGAASIARALLGASQSLVEERAVAMPVFVPVIAEPNPLPNQPSPQSSSPSPFDPYAGAAVSGR